MIRITTIEEHEENVIAMMARMSRTIGHVDLRIGNRLCEISAKDAISFGKDIMELGAAAEALLPKPEVTTPVESAPTVINADGSMADVATAQPVISGDGNGDVSSGQAPDDDETELTIG